MSPWRFVDLDATQKHARRETIDHYGRIAHLSTVLPVLAGAAYQLGRWALMTYRRREHGGTRADVGGASSSFSSSSHRRGTYAAVPGSPALKHRHQHQTGSVLGSLRTTARRWTWWLGGDVVFLGDRTWGQRDQWVFGTGWMVWLLVLSLLGTGDGMSFRVSVSSPTSRDQVYVNQ